MAEKARNPALLAAALILVPSVWFAGAPHRRPAARRPRITRAEAGWLTAAVQFGFVAGTLALALLSVVAMWRLAPLLPPC